ncbi:MAG TPA: cytochrome c oxidase subunit 3 [Paracoccaceae bacterium]|nr:cytochrome c oxidase subunit 3 [Paracoccaceae bacterium]
MAHQKNHDYHILAPSIWPFLGAVGGFTMLFGTVLFFHDNGPWLMIVGMAIVAYVMFAWWSDVIRESLVGDHTPVVQLSLRYGMILFIASEVAFFSAWFWTFFKHALYPMPAVGAVWPPEGIETFDPWHLPFVNTLILLLSGCAATWAHHALVHENDRKALVQGLAAAIALGVLFTITQAYEYSHAAFGFAGNIYGASFFMATGFHGAHVIIGTIFLFVCLMRALSGQLSPEKHIGFEAAAWYWHFVDVVWLFLFACIYIWGG